MEFFQQEERTTHLFSEEQRAVHGMCRRMVLGALSSRRTTLPLALDRLSLRAHVLTEMAMLLIETLSNEHKVLVAGNGGSAAEAQHFAAELVGRFKRERPPYAVIALTTDSAILTAVANDYGYEQVFARQVKALGQEDDIFLAFSTSGTSKNILLAAEAAQESHMKIIAVTGEKSSPLAEQADLALQVPGIDTATDQELHMIVTHILCDIVETHLMETEHSESRSLLRMPSSLKKREDGWQ